MTEIVGMTNNPDRDIFTQEVIPGEWTQRNDGQYSWDNDLSWYAQKYNLVLPDDFKNHILANC